MSGGAFDYQEYKITMIADEIQNLIDSNNTPNQSSVFSDATIAEFEKAIEYLRIAHVYAYRIDWLVSGDNGEDTFHLLLKRDLNRIKGE
jgi:hypothetical protein